MSVYSSVPRYLKARCYFLLANSAPPTSGTFADCLALRAPTILKPFALLFDPCIIL